jgi:NAD(P)-dependent dehydrogenase (short-subunit alcohol dehydrogenase family)
VVTGAASGIGLAVARRLVAEGVSVVAVDRDGDRLAAVDGVEPVVADVTDPADRDRIAVSAGGIDYLVNAAGVILLAPIDQVTLADWRRQFEVNAEAVFFLSQGLAPRLRPGGSIVNIASAVAKLGTVEGAAYAASKAAVLSMTRSLATFLAKQGIRVNAVCPGIIDTPMQDAVIRYQTAAQGIGREELLAARLRAVPLGRMARPEEVASVVAFLLSPDAGYLTGQAINVTGGMVTW